MIKGKWKGKKRDFHFRNEGENMTDKKKKKFREFIMKWDRKERYFKRKKKIYEMKKKKLMHKRYRKKDVDWVGHCCNNILIKIMVIQK